MTAPSKQNSTLRFNHFTRLVAKDVAVQEEIRGSECCHEVLGSRESVAFSWNDHVVHSHSALSEPFDDLVGLILVHACIVLALYHQQRGPNRVYEVNGRPIVPWWIDRGSPTESRALAASVRVEL